jgi:hypothetical protein
MEALESVKKLTFDMVLNLFHKHQENNKEAATTFRPVTRKQCDGNDI